MSAFDYEHGELFADGVSVQKLVQTYGTPLYIYVKSVIENQWHQFNKALHTRDHLIAYAVKANSNIAILQLLAKLGSGFDIASQGELERVIMAGGDAKKVIFSGVAKSESEIKRALELAIYCFNVESLPELMRINDVAKRLNCTASIALRINPDIDAKTHPYIATGDKENKFGIHYNCAIEVYKMAQSLPHLAVIGVSFHIGSQLTELSPLLAATDRLLKLINALAKEGISLKHIDVGGGLGITYKDEMPPSIKTVMTALLTRLMEYPDLKIIVEPGRVLVAEAGILVARVEYLKHYENLHFAIVDTGMNDLLRPALYDAWMRIIPVQMHKHDYNKQKYHIVGPVCESSDYLGKDRVLNLVGGDLIAVCAAGAYGFSMGSQYNSRLRPAEVLVDGSISYLIRKREMYQDLWRGEQLPSENDGEVQN